MRETFIKRYVVERTDKAEVRPEENEETIRGAFKDYVRRNKLVR